MLQNYPQYGSMELQKLWMDTDKYYSEKKWEEEKISDVLRPTFQMVMRKFGGKNLVGAEVGIGNCLHAQSVYNKFHFEKFYLIDLHKPVREPGLSLLEQENVEFIQGDSLQALKQLPNNLDFVYLDSSHEFDHVLQEISIAYPKLKTGGIIGGHDYEHMGVMSAVNTFVINLFSFNKKIRSYVKDPMELFQCNPCFDEHPGYPEEYSKMCLPLDWFTFKFDDNPVKDDIEGIATQEDYDYSPIEIKKLRNG